jgi:hypothetical protein
MCLYRMLLKITMDVYYKSSNIYDIIWYLNHTKPYFI